MKNWREENYLSLEVGSIVLITSLISNITECLKKVPDPKQGTGSKLVNENWHCLCPPSTLSLREEDKPSSNDQTPEVELKTVTSSMTERF